eukprot:c1214_g1_i1.p1 GENE.c1214_g1_i1~~c1214_g1_i1.p1  ORF type:complete len:249 (+),score=45.96 c1214_g1_i1:235-981(+)
MATVPPTDPPCELFDTFGVAVQATMGLLAFNSLVVKRFNEFPQRPWIVWAFDTSKQAIGASTSHLFNTLLGLLFGASTGSACTWYLVHSFLDTTLGMLFNFVLIKSLDYWGSGRFGALDSGFYGHPPSHKVWFRQLMVWLFIVFLSKVFVTLAVMLDQVNNDGFFEACASLFLFPFSFNPQVELIVVMLLVPFVLNVTVFWVQDNFLKKSTRNATANWISYSSLETLVAQSDEIPPTTTYETRHNIRI